jgi:hypothetical protein
MVKGTADEVALVKREMAQAKRDLAGFVLDDQPHVTEEQLAFLATRLGVESDAIACALSNTDPAVLKTWRDDPVFQAVFETWMGNKREAFRQFGSHVLPKIMRVLWAALDSPKESDRIKAINLWLRSQALLIDKVERYDPDQMQQLIAQLREPVRTNVIDVTPKVLTGG